MLETSHEDRWLWATIVALVLVLIGVVAFFALIPGSPLLRLARAGFDWLFAASTVQALWYVTRAAGIIAYLLLWLSTVWGLAVSSKIFDPVLNRYFTYDMHQFLSLLSLGFVALHVIVLLADQYLPFSVAQVLVPFIAPYRPVWVGIGVIGMYLAILVSVTFYVRNLIGYSAFRVIHYLSFISYVGAAVHGLLSGTDSSLWSMQLVYAGTTLIVVFLFVYRVVVAVLRPEKQAAAQ